MKWQVVESHDVLTLSIARISPSVYPDDDAVMLQ